MGITAAAHNFAPALFVFAYLAQVLPRDLDLGGPLSFLPPSMMRIAATSSLTGQNVESCGSRMHCELLEVQVMSVGEEHTDSSYIAWFTTGDT